MLCSSSEGCEAVILVDMVAVVPVPALALINIDLYQSDLCAQEEHYE